MSVRARAMVLVVAALVASASVVQAQQGFNVDAALAKKGKSLFTNKGCLGCHSVGKGKRAGPDLAGVTERRPLEWLRRFMKDPTPLFQSDSLAQVLLAEYNNVKMPNMRLKDEEVEALLHYLAQESQAAGGGDG